MDPMAALLHILEFHRGRNQAISADELLMRMKRFGCDVPSLPAMRDLVHDARKDRHLIASCDAGYFLPVDLAEATEFIEKLRTPAIDMLHTARIMRTQARQEFGEGQQLRMI